MDPRARKDPPPSAQNANSGMRQGGALPVFTFLFCGFVALHLFWPNLMARELLNGQSEGAGNLNIALTLGITIILAAILLGMSGGPRRP